MRSLELRELAIAWAVGAFGLVVTTYLVAAIAMTVVMVSMSVFRGRAA